MSTRRIAGLAALASTLVFAAAPAPAAGSASPLFTGSLQPDTKPERPSARRVDLRPKFRQGEQIRYTMTIDSVNDVKSPQLPELDQKQVMRQEIGLIIRVVEAGTDGSTIELVYDRLKVSLESDAFTATFDSADPKHKKANPGKGAKPPKSPNTPDPAPAPGLNTDILNQNDEEFFATAMRGIVGTVVTIELDASGNILSVSGTDTLALGGGMPGVGGPGGGSWLVSSPGQTGYAAVGETWSTTSSLGNTPLGSFTMVTNYTLRSAAGGRATIGISGGIDAGTSPGAPGQTGGVQIRDSKYNGSYTWDTEAGQLREMQTTQSAVIEGSPMGVPMTMKSSTDMRVKRTR